MIVVSPSKARRALQSGAAYSLTVPFSTRLGHLEDVLRDLRARQVETTGYDIHPEPVGYRVEVWSTGERMVDAELAHADLRLLGLGECIGDDRDELEGPEVPLFRIEGVAHAEDLLVASRAFTWIESVVPRRYANEELGDALEEISIAIENGRSQWWVRFKIVTALVWVIIHAAVEEYARYGKHKDG